MESAFLAIAGVHLIALASPGPDVFIVMQTAAKRSRKEAFFCVLGITLGVAFWASLAILGLNWLFEHFIWLHKISLILGGSYLLWMGIRILKGILARNPSEVSFDQPKVMSVSLLKAFTTGLFTNLANAKAIIYFSSVFAVFIKPGMPQIEAFSIFALVVCETLIWFTLVAFVLGLPKPKQIYRSLNRWIDGICGVIFGGFGIALLYAAIKD